MKGDEPFVGSVNSPSLSTNPPTEKTYNITTKNKKTDITSSKNDKPFVEGK